MDHNAYLGVDINTKDDCGDTPLLKLYQIYKNCGQEITKRLRILIEFNASLEVKDNNGIEVMILLNENVLLTINGDHNLLRPTKRQRILES